MVDMLSVVKNEFPDLYTKRGLVRKTEPKRYKCKCGNSFNKIQRFNVGGLGFGIPVCTECGERAEKSVANKIWSRLINHQIEQEDFILNAVIDNPSISKEQLNTLLNEKFATKTNALGHLVYFGYLTVDKEKRDTLKIIEYKINKEKDLLHRYEKM